MEINLKEKYLPVGTVVLLKGGKKRVMVTGFCVVSPEVEKRVFDYCGCIYPEGYLNSAQNCLFNHDQIDKIYHVGLVDDEEMKFKTQLKEIAPSIDAEFADLVKETANAVNNSVNSTPDVPAAPQPMEQSTPVAPSQPSVEIPSAQPIVPPVVEPAPVAQPTVSQPVAQQPQEQPSVINFIDQAQNDESQR